MTLDAGWRIWNRMMVASALAWILHCSGKVRSLFFFSASVSVVGLGFVDSRKLDLGVYELDELVNIADPAVLDIVDVVLEGALQDVVGDCSFLLDPGKVDVNLLA